MYVGVLRLSLHIPSARSLKDKRRVVRGLVDRVRARHRVAIAEVADNDVHDRGVVGFAVVGNDRRAVRSVLDAVMRTVEDTCPAEVVESEVEVTEW